MYSSGSTFVGGPASATRGVSTTATGSDAPQFCINSQITTAAARRRTPITAYFAFPPVVAGGGFVVEAATRSLRVRTDEPRQDTHPPRRSNDGVSFDDPAHGCDVHDH